MRTLRIALAQINTTVGDLDGNARKIIDWSRRAERLGADLVAFPELAIAGYPPEDLLFKRQFVEDNEARMREVAVATGATAAVFGFVDGRGGLYNAAAIARNGHIAGVYRKALLPNYGVFDEKRYFTPGEERPVFVIGGVRVGVNVCEDIWTEDGPAAAQSAAGAQVIVNISASPFWMGKSREREDMLSRRAAAYGAHVAYVNLVGGQDELAFDGGSVVFDPSGRPIARAERFEEDLIAADIVLPERAAEPEAAVAVSQAGAARRAPLPARQPQTYDGVGEIYAALVMGTRDYIRKTGFRRTLVALSGGVDSSLVATIAVDALGADRVRGVSMPSGYSSEGSVLDARDLAENLGIELSMASIEDVFAAALSTLAPHFGGLPPDTAEENLQSRIRGLLIMGMSNKSGSIVLTTGNKSEMAVGYATIYGDMAGGFAAIKDVPKTMVYALCRYRNALGAAPVIPEAVLTKPPSAELRPDQTDQDSLPPYDVLDPILEAYVEDDRSFAEIVGDGFDAGVVRDVIAMVDRNEHKRRQAPPGIKITQRNFGRDRRMPIANRYRPY